MGVGAAFACKWHVAVAEVHVIDGSESGDEGNFQVESGYFEWVTNERLKGMGNNKIIAAAVITPWLIGGGIGFLLYKLHKESYYAKFIKDAQICPHCTIRKWKLDDFLLFVEIQLNKNRKDMDKEALELEKIFRNGKDRLKELEMEIYYQRSIENDWEMEVAPPDPKYKKMYNIGCDRILIHMIEEAFDVFN